MKRIIAISVLVLGVFLMIFGIGARTIWAKPTEYTKTIQLPEDLKYAVLPLDEVAKLPGQPEIQVASEAPVSQGRMVDIQAWVKPYAHAVLHVDKATGEISAEPVPEQGAAKEKQSPAGSDLWLGSFDPEQGRVSAKLDVVAKDQGMLFSVVTEQQSIGEIKIIWHRPLRTPLAGPFLVAGGVLTLVGIILFLIFLDRDRRGLGAQRNRDGVLLGLRDAITMKHQRDRRKAKKASMVAVVAAGAMLLSGCSPSYWPQISASKHAAATDEKTPAGLTSAQFDRIVRSVSEVSVAADRDRNVDKLKSRFAGAALEQRAKNYQIRSKIPDYAVKLPVILPERLNYELAQSTDTWPRIALVAVKSGTELPASGQAPQASEKSPSLLLRLKQDDPQSNYKVENVFSLRGGIQMPEAAPATDGTAVLKNDISALLVQPSQVAAKYGAILKQGANNDNAKDFDLNNDQLLTRAGAGWVKSEKDRIASREGKADFDIDIATDDASTVAVSTGANGALVLATIKETRITKAADGSELPVTPVIGALVKLDGAQKELRQVVQHQLIFFVPNKGTDAKIQLLGSSSELVGAEGKK